MSARNPTEDIDKKFEPWNEEDGGIRRTPGEDSEYEKLAGPKKDDPLESLYKAPSATASDRLKNQPKSSGAMQGVRSFVFGRKLGRKSSLITILALLFGGGGFLTVFFTPSLALNALVTPMTQAFNDQFHAAEERSSMLLEAKLSDTTKGSCGLVKVACRFASMSDTQAKRFKDAGIDVERKEGFLLKNRGQITKMTFTQSDGTKVEITKAEQLHRLSLENIEFRAAQTKAYNVMFATLKDAVVEKVLKRLKAREMPVTGETDEERDKRLNDAVGGTNDGSGRPLVETEDKDKGTTYSVDGEEISKDQANGAKSIADQIKSIKDSGGYQSFAKGALRGLSVLGAAQTACGAYTFGSVVSNLGQIEKGAQAVRFAMTGALSTESAQRAGEADEGTVNFIMNRANATQAAGQVLDESTFSQSGTTQSAKLINNSSANENAFDSDEYKWAAYQEAPANRDISESRFMLGGGTPTSLTSSLNAIATVVSPDNPTQKGVREKCHIINNPFVTVAALGAGIVLGAGSFGVTTALGIAGSIGFSMLTPYFMSQIADIIAGDTFKDLSGKDFGSGLGVGTSFFLSSVARARGGKPLNKAEGAEYLQKNMAATVAYNDTESYIARNTPLDASNRYSFLGSIMYKMSPLVEKSKTSASAAMMSMANLIPTAMSSLSPTAKAASTFDPNFLSCNDPQLLSVGVNGDFNCVVHYGETESGLKIKPVENAQYMASTGNIDPDSETGEPKDNGQPWNYVKFLSECVNRTTGLGVANENDEEDGSNCTDPAKEPMNEQFRSFTMYRTINDSMDTAPRAMTTDDVEAYTDGQSGTVTAGWSFPTKDDAVISQAFNTATGRDKSGVTLTAKNPADTEGLPIFAVYDGTVVAAGPDEQLDNRIVLNHFVNGQLISSVYGHLGKNSIAVTVGQAVKAGQQIGTVTAVEGADGARLYVEIWEGPITTGQPVDPMGPLSVTRKAKEKTGA